MSAIRLIAGGIRATCSLRDPPLWKRATNDAGYGAPARLRNDSCAIGASWTPAKASKRLGVVTRAAVDSGNRTSHVKEKGEAPITIDRGTICQLTSELFDRAKPRATAGLVD